MKSRKKLGGLIALLVAIALLLGFFVFWISSTGIKDEKMKVVVLKTGKSDAIVVQSGGKTMLIDTAEADDASKVVKYLKNENINTIDTIIITHFDKDHLGSSGLIFETFDVKQVLVPDYEGTIEEYGTFMKALEAALIEPTPVSSDMDFEFGEVSVHVEPPENYDANLIGEVVDDIDNTMSLMTEITCGEKKFLFGADADKRRVNEWLGKHEGEHFDIIKCPHHGKYNAVMEELLKSASPNYMLVTCSKKNPADETMISLMTQYGVDVFQTRDGRITVLTDGNIIKVMQN